MKNVWRNIFLCVLVVVIFIMPVSTAESKIRDSVGQNTFSINRSLNGGWLEEIDDVRILHVNGSYYDMGFQHGSLLKNEVMISLRTQLAYCEENEWPFERILGVWYTMESYLPHKYKEEMQGLADGAGMSFEQVAVLNTIPEIFNNFFEEACCGIALWGDATVDGKLYHIRSYDWPFNLTDPETGTFFQENSLLIVRTPEMGYASIAPEYAGDVSVYNGINEKGIAVGENTCVTKDITHHGISPAFRMRMVMDSASSADEAIDILMSNRTCGTNFVVSDANVPIGYALDQSANLSYVGKWDNPVEDTSPFWQIKDVARRSPMYIYPACAAIEDGRIIYDPSGLRGFLHALLGTSYSFIPWTHYRALSDEIERRYGTLDLNESMSLLRDEYTGKTDPIFRFGINNFVLYTCHFQWVACPETGDLVISFATPDRKACYNEVHYFNLFDLMNTDPHPNIEIAKPRNSYLYIGLREISPTISKKTFIIGRTPIKVSASQEEDTEKVEFYLDDKLIETVTETPFAAMLDETAFWKHTILAKAYYADGSTPTDQMDVMIFNI